jgi:hypothetical protein
LTPVIDEDAQQRSLSVELYSAFHGFDTGDVAIRRLRSTQNATRLFRRDLLSDEFELVCCSTLKPSERKDTGASASPFRGITSSPCEEMSSPAPPSEFASGSGAPQKNNNAPSHRQNGQRGAGISLYGAGPS